MIAASFRFHSELNDFLPSDRKEKSFVYHCDANASIKDTIEAIGVPHVEIDVIVAGGVSIGFTDRLERDTHISVYPAHASIEMSNVIHLLPPPLPVCRFVLDVHLGLLARRLRMLGFDTLYRNDYTDHQLVRISVADDRIALTRDTGLLKHAALQRGRWVRSPHASYQTAEIIDAFGLREQARPFTRCISCNGTVESVSKDAIAGRVPARVVHSHSRFFMCRSCGRVYWGGSHYAHMRGMVDSLLREEPRCP